MPPDVGPNYNSGGQDAQPGQGNPDDLKLVLQAVVTELDVMRTAFIALTAKIDADSGDTGGDNDYAATVDPPATTLTQS